MNRIKARIERVFVYEYDWQVCLLLLALLPLWGPAILTVILVFGLADRMQKLLMKRLANKRIALNMVGRLVRRFWVRRSEYDQAISALRVAHGHIMSHHAVNVMERLKAGSFCPVCHHADHTEPEINQITEALHSANNAGERTGGPSAGHRYAPAAGSALGGER